MTCVTSQPLVQDSAKFLGAGTSSEIYRYFNSYWNQITPGNDGKWGSVENIQGNYNWTNLDVIYNYAKSRDLRFKEHTLIWGQQQPWWITSLDSAAQRTAVENWIKNLCARYSEVSLIDVVNEPFNAPPEYKDALGGDGETGWDWVITAFEMARTYSPPDAVLILNEYNVLHDNPTTTNYLNLINLLIERDLIDGIGIQGHYFEFRSHVDATSNVYVYNISTIRSNLDRLAETGIPVYITEFDIDEADDNNQLEQYKIYFPIFWEHPGVKGITFWGYIEGDVWYDHPDTYLLFADGTERPALQWMRTYVISPIPPELVSPLYQSGLPRNPELIWRPSKTAMSYRAQVSPSLTFSSLAMDTTVGDTSVQSVVLNANSRYHWRVSAINDNGSSNFSSTGSFVTGDQITTIESGINLNEGYALYQNYPNPFNPETTISFILPRTCQVQLILLNIAGEKVMTLASGAFNAGEHHFVLNASVLASGVYFYKLEAGNAVQTKKLIVIK